MEILFIMAGVGVLALIVWCVETREAAPKQRDWPIGPVEAREASIGTSAEVTDEAQDAAKAEDAYIRSVAKDLPNEFMLDGVRVEIGVFWSAGPKVCVDDIEVIRTHEGRGGIVGMKIHAPEIWAVLRPRLQQIADERKAAAEAEKAAKHADILAKLGAT